VNALATRIRNSRRASVAVVVGTVVVLTAFVWMVVVSPKRSDASRLTDEVSSTQSQLAIATQQAATARRTKAIAEAVQTALPGTADEPGILDGLNAVGAQTGVVVSAVSPNQAVTATNAVALNVTVEGKYFQIRDFLHRLRTQVKLRQKGVIKATGRLFDVTSVQIQQPTPGSSTLTATLAVNAYSFGPTSTAAAATSTTETTTTPAGATAAGSN